ncbi:unnamed protein product [Didymodactylos carnosus]|uniref:Cobalamin-independent methionine synthase MetE C-terminal/archaeal domain-containing protein n=1 Tax=Didymodactylos carnosus TaxID=1234261 RepID=A0A815FFJ0_9BILA|nr:unnamed protein product [Didymodactylos carnosus]CAF4170384.1 unnamed protein product [Didymodactylos carnosus]
MLTIPTEPIGSIPRPARLVNALKQANTDKKHLLQLYDDALRDTVERFAQTRSPVISDGEQTKPSFFTYPIHESEEVMPGGIVIQFCDGHTRSLPKLVHQGPFRYQTYANEYLTRAKQLTKLPVKQAVISVSALSLLYPQSETIPGYSREQFFNDLVNEGEADIRKCLQNGAHSVQIDFTEGRLSLKLDPSGTLLKSFIDLNNRVLNRFTDKERQYLGVHSCSGGDQCSTHSADVDYSQLLPMLFELNVTNFYVQYASERDKHSILKLIRDNIKPNQRIFLGVINVLDERIETPDEICQMIVDAARVIPVEQLGTTDDCGFSPFSDDMSRTRDIAFEKINARVQGTKLAEEKLVRK